MTPPSSSPSPRPARPEAGADDDRAVRRRMIYYSVTGTPIPKTKKERNKLAAILRPRKRKRPDELRAALGFGDPVSKIEKEAAMEGRVSKYDEGKGYGFILPDGGGRAVFFHRTSVMGDPSAEALKAGARVSFRSEISPKGTRALGVLIIDDEAAKE